MKSSDLKFFDQRTYQRNIELGFIKKDDYQKHLKTLPDDDGNFDNVSFEDLDPPAEEPAADTLEETLDLGEETETA